MLPYQPYNPMFNPNIPNPNYPSQPQPQQSPLQSYQQRPPIIPGRVVTDINEVTPNEIPMDGRVSLFPKNDYSCIYAKAWNSDGTITTVRDIWKAADPELRKNIKNNLTMLTNELAE